MASLKISIITPSFSHNVLARAYLLASVLQRKYAVDIVGLRWTDTTWGPLRDMDNVTYKSIGVTKIPYWQLIKLMDEIDADVIYASKPLISSFGIGILKKIITRKPLVLDIDDWECGFISENYFKLSRMRRYKELVYSAINFKDGSDFSRLASEKMISFADDITVSNQFLQKLYGGVIVPHCRDTNTINPEKFDKNLLREKYGIGQENKVVMFLGSPTVYKGVEILIDAMALLPDTNLMLCIVGLDESYEYCRFLKQYAINKLNSRFKMFGLVPFNNVPELLAITDIVVIPQKKCLATVGQLPAKVFDAMAMAKPIIATDVSDLPEILDGCGIIIEPNNSEQLADRIKYIFDHWEESVQMGTKARQKCIEKYNYDAMEKILIDIFSKYE